MGVFEICLELVVCYQCLKQRLFDPSTSVKRLSYVPALCHVCPFAVVSQLWQIIPILRVQLSARTRLGIIRDKATVINACPIINLNVCFNIFQRVKRGVIVLIKRVWFSVFRCRLQPRHRFVFKRGEWFGNVFGETRFKIPFNFSLNCCMVFSSKLTNRSGVFSRVVPCLRRWEKICPFLSGGQASCA